MMYKLARENCPICNYKLKLKETDVDKYSSQYLIDYTYECEKCLWDQINKSKDQILYMGYQEGDDIIAHLLFNKHEKNDILFTESFYLNGRNFAIKFKYYINNNYCGIEYIKQPIENYHQYNDPWERLNNYLTALPAVSENEIINKSHKKENGDWEILIDVTRELQRIRSKANLLPFK